ncbi:MAG: acetyl-CoA carboxylase carboxyl transferase subunit beta [Kiritimatiellia bacterium]|jgi:acetyl-CoA carboxylase carboxyl transferase subunit beta
MTNQGRRWFEQRKEFIGGKKPNGSEVPDLLTKCQSCAEPLFNDILAEHMFVCPHCGYHFRIFAETRLEQLIDEGSAVMHDEDLAPVDVLGFVDSKPYTTRIELATKKTGRNDAFMSASATIDNVPVEIGVLDFRYMGGSMGSVVGECITRLYERAIKNDRPAIVVSASGGARMQEGVLSLMQMAKTCAALARLKDEAGMPYISVLTHPTTGGVAASFAMLGDIIVAEPAALIGFAGARVIEQTIGESLPEGFQTSEYLLDHGMVDRIVRRQDLREELATMLRQLLGLPAATHAAPRINVASSADPAISESTVVKVDGAP